MNPQRWLMRFAAFGLAWWVQTAVAQTETARYDKGKGILLAGTKVSNAVKAIDSHPDIVMVANSMQADPVAVADVARRSKVITEGKNVEINFFGKVVDQDDKPLAGVSVQAQTREWHMKNPFEEEGKFLSPVTVSGADGLFSFTRLKGDSFQILAITKNGYTLSPKAKLAYSYGPLPHHYLPNPLQPVVFRMWMTNGAVPLFAVKISTHIPQDGTAIAFDLRRNKVVASPDDFEDIRVALNHHAPPGQRNGRIPFDWSFEVGVPDGGVLPTEDEFMFLAPAQGYMSKWLVTRSKEDSNWKARGEVNLYLNNRAGQQFGRLTFSFRPEPGRPSGYIVIEGYLNPNGRGLESDSTRNLRADQANQPRPRSVPAPGGPPTSPQPANGAATPPPSTFPPPGFPALPPQFTPPTNNLTFPQPPPGFQTLTNRGRPFPPPAPPRPPQ